MGDRKKKFAREGAQRISESIERRAARDVGEEDQKESTKTGTGGEYQNRWGGQENKNLSENKLK